ncbi:hypothetical protein HAX54_053016 [Datura stramonium]|uniref:Uncharacterized protein n=1 Tax=Datura stramonium TaxID=4076 RepID=A0ABS8WR83_DATST|nr:hypothetical protein [Datura stramonium]
MRSEKVGGFRFGEEDDENWFSRSFPVTARRDGGLMELQVMHDSGQIVARDNFGGVVLYPSSVKTVGLCLAFQELGGVALRPLKNPGKWGSTMIIG